MQQSEAEALANVRVWTYAHLSYVFMCVHTHMYDAPAYDALQATAMALASDLNLCACEVHCAWCSYSHRSHPGSALLYQLLRQQL